MDTNKKNNNNNKTTQWTMERTMLGLFVDQKLYNKINT